MALFLRHTFIQFQASSSGSSQCGESVVKVFAVMALSHRARRRRGASQLAFIVAGVYLGRYAMGHIFLSGVLKLVLLSVVLAYAADVLQRMCMYFPQPRDATELSICADMFGRVGYELRDFPYQVKFGIGGSALRQRGLLVLPSSSSTAIDNLWVLCGGNAMVSTDWLPILETLLCTFPAGAGKSRAPGFLLLDYPGYGCNQGSVCAAVALRSGLAGVEAALQNLREASDCAVTATSLPREPASIAFLGHSLGAAAVAQLAAALAVQQPSWLGSCSLGKVILSAPFTSIPAMGQFLFGCNPGARAGIRFLALISRHDWDNCRSLRALARALIQNGGPADIPSISIIHGTHDEVVPVHMGRHLWKLCKVAGLRKCEFIERPQATHNDILEEAVSVYARIIFGASICFRCRLQAYYRPDEVHVHEQASRLTV